MDHWRRRADVRRRAWDFLRLEVRPDVALLQETNPIGEFPGSVYRAEVVRQAPIVPQEATSRCLARDLNLLQRFEALGFHNVVVRDDGPLPGCDCHAGDSCRHVQTQRHDRSTFPWQNDYVFVTSDILERKPLLEVFDREDAWELSGHCPVVIEWNDTRKAGLQAAEPP